MISAAYRCCAENTKPRTHSNKRAKSPCPVRARDTVQSSGCPSDPDTGVNPVGKHETSLEVPMKTKPSVKNRINLGRDLKEMASKAGTNFKLHGRRYIVLATATCMILAYTGALFGCSTSGSSPKYSAEQWERMKFKSRSTGSKWQPKNHPLRHTDLSLPWLELHKPFITNPSVFYPRWRAGVRKWERAEEARGATAVCWYFRGQVDFDTDVNFTPMDITCLLVVGAAGVEPAEICAFTRVCSGFPNVCGMSIFSVRPTPPAKNLIMVWYRHSLFVMANDHTIIEQITVDTNSPMKWSYGNDGNGSWPKRKLMLVGNNYYLG